MSVDKGGTGYGTKKGTDLDRCFGTTDVSQDKEKCRALVNPVIKIQVS